MSIKTDLQGEFRDQLNEVHKMDVGDEKYKIAVDGVTKLADRIIEIEKLEQTKSENAAKQETLNAENELKAEQIKIDKRDKITRNVIEAIKVGGGFGLTAWAFIASMNFEKEGKLFTTEGGRSVLRSLLKFMK